MAWLTSRSRTGSRSATRLCGTTSTTPTKSLVYTIARRLCCTPSRRDWSTSSRLAAPALGGSAPRRHRGCLRNLLLTAAVAIGLLVILGALSAIGAQQRRQSVKTQAVSTPAAVLPASPIPANKRVLMTYYFYWYDSLTGAHLNPPAVLNNHFPSSGPLPSWRSPEWHRKQLQDMAEAGIDIVLPVYW